MIFADRLYLSLGSGEIRRPVKSEFLECRSAGTASPSAIEILKDTWGVAGSILSIEKFYCVDETKRMENYTVTNSTVVVDGIEDARYSPEHPTSVFRSSIFHVFGFWKFISFYILFQALFSM